MKKVKKNTYGKRRTLSMMANWTTTMTTTTNCMYKVDMTKRWKMEEQQ